MPVVLVMLDVEPIEVEACVEKQANFTNAAVEGGLERCERTMHAIVRDDEEPYGEPCLQCQQQKVRDQQGLCERPEKHQGDMRQHP